MAVYRPHFVPADHRFICNECNEEFPQDSLMLVYTDRVPATTGVRGSQYYCEECGKLLLESLYNG